MATATVKKTIWTLTGQGYEFCNCDFGCGCNFGGFPNSKDGSCRALVGLHIRRGTCGAVDLSGVKCAGVPSGEYTHGPNSLKSVAGFHRTATYSPRSFTVGEFSFSGVCVTRVSARVAKSMR